MCSIVKNLFHEKCKLVDEINGENSLKLKKICLLKMLAIAHAQWEVLILCQLMHAVNGSQSFDSYIDLTLIMSSLRVP